MATVTGSRHALQGPPTHCLPLSGSSLWGCGCSLPFCPPGLPPTRGSPLGGGGPSRGQAHMCGHLCCVLCADLGTESVSGTLSSLQQCQPQDSFDVFAQTRGSASAEQRNPYAGALLMALGTLGG